MNLGCLSSQTPIKWTMFVWLNLLIIIASIKKSSSACCEASNGRVYEQIRIQIHIQHLCIPLIYEYLIMSISNNPSK